jgi:PAS domain S-box-containing protein
MGNLQHRLESLFAGLRDAPPRTGLLTPEKAKLAHLRKPSGWMWESDADGRYTWCSPEVETILGYAPGELVGKEVYKTALISPNEELQRLMTSGEPVHDIRAKAQSSDGKSVTLLVNARVRDHPSGEKLGHSGVAQVLERDRIKPELRGVQLTQKIAASQPPSAKAPEGIKPMFIGYEVDEYGIHALESDEHPGAKDEKAVDDAISIPIRLQDRTLGILEFEGNELGRPWNTSERALVEAIAEDLAQALQLAHSHEMTKQALDEMREADRLKSQFLANMSHELRTPLNSIIGFSHVILKGIDGPINETQEQDLTAIYNAGQHLLGLINDILDVSRIEAGKMELAFTDVDVAEIIRGVMSTAVGLVKNKPIELIIDIPEELPIIRADNIRVRQILLNLISNAVKFTAQGQIGVSARLIERDFDREIVVAVFDTGLGISPKDQEKLFEPFSQVDASTTRKTTGTGLGLSICRHLVELHGGRIWVESVLGEGSTFVFTLPLRPPAIPAEEGVFLILGIEEEPRTLERYQDLFGEFGYSLHPLTEPQDTVRLASELKPSAILLDLLLSDQNSWQIFEDLGRNPATRSIPVILCAFSEEQDKGFCLRPAHHLSKPINRNELHQLLHDLFLSELAPPDVLVIEDKQQDRENINTFLKDHGCRTVSNAHSAQSGMEEIHKHIPDLIMVNMLMPDYEGFQLVEALQRTESTRNVPIIMITRSDAQPAEKLLLEDGMRRLIRRGLVPASEYMANLQAITADLASPD